MLRALVIALLALNLGFYAWTQGWLDGMVGVRAQGDREPERLSRQVRPETVRVLTPQAVAAAASVAESKLVCMEAGPYSPADVASAEGAASAMVPAAKLTRKTDETPAVWIVYMGKYGEEALKRKQEELERIHVASEPVKDMPELEPGLMLGRFDSLEAARDGLAALVERGVRTARVRQLSKAATVHRLRVERVDPELAVKLSALKSEALGKGFVPCDKAK